VTTPNSLETLHPVLASFVAQITVALDEIDLEYLASYQDHLTSPAAASFGQGRKSPA